MESGKSSANFLWAALGLSVLAALNAQVTLTSGRYTGPLIFEYAASAFALGAACQAVVSRHVRGWMWVPVVVGVAVSRLALSDGVGRSMRATAW